METEMTLHQAKMNLLRVVDRIRTIDDVQAIQQILANYYAQKAEAEMDRLWDNGTINEQVIEQWGQEHIVRLVVSSLYMMCSKPSKTGNNYAVVVEQ